jgi:hypothetical protein
MVHGLDRPKEVSSILVTNELFIKRKEAFWVKYEVLCRNCSRGTIENHKQSDRILCIVVNVRTKYLQITS